MSDFGFMSACQLLKAIRDKRISSSELLSLYIERVQRINPSINAIVATNFEGARERAKAADHALAKDESWGPLHGLPMTIKDHFEVAHMPCAAGSLDYQNHVPEENAAVVESLVNAGAIVFGKTNMPRFGRDVQSYNEVYGQTNNPWDISLTPGGSSGGSAAALATGMTALEIGGDLGGSIRIPAHFCGVYGHKPTFNLVSHRGMVPPPPKLRPGHYQPEPDIDVIGPLARSPEDLDLVLDIITQPQVPLSLAWRFALPQPRKENLEDYRVGLWLDDPYCPVDKQVGDCLQNAVDFMAKAGVRVENKRPKIDFASCIGIFSKLVSSVASAGDSLDEFRQKQEACALLSENDLSAKAQHLRGATLLHREWIVLDYLRGHIRKAWAEFFRDFDVLLCPVAPITAFAHDPSDHPFERFDRVLAVNGQEQGYFETMLRWVGLIGVSYLPATSAPIGFARNGLPVGVQIVGPYLEDKTPIHFAKLLREIVGGFAPPPGFD